MKRNIFSIWAFISLSIYVCAQEKILKQIKQSSIDTAKFVMVEGGSFKMGTDKPVEQHEGPTHAVKVSSFYLAKTETTFGDYDKFCLETKRDTTATSWGKGKQPAMMASWLDAVAYCNWLSESEGLSKCYSINSTDVKTIDTGRGYRLPTEAEWEYAARGGIKGKGTFFSGSNEINQVGWYADNSSAKTYPVAQKVPNELGLYDMTGNVWEWVWDWYDGNYYQSSPTDNPQGPSIGNYRVMRGGAWYNYGNYSTVYTRQNHHPGFRQNSVGFRVARTYFKPQKDKETNNR